MLTIVSVARVVIVVVIRYLHPLCVCPVDDAIVLLKMRLAYVDAT